MSRLAIIPTELAMRHWRLQGYLIKDVQPALSILDAQLKRIRDEKARTAPLPFNDLPPEAA